MKLLSIGGLAAVAAAIVFALPAGAASPTGPQWGTGGGPAAAKVGVQGITVLSTAVNPINGFWNQGWWSDNVGNENSNTNYIAGTFFAGGDRWRDYFTFDISSIPNNPCPRPQSATLSMDRGSGAGPALLIYSLYGVDTDPFTLSQKDNNPDAAIFNDLGSGPVYGTYLLPTTGTGNFNLALNTTALYALDAARANGETFFSLGGAIVPQPAGQAWLMGFTGEFAATLTVNYPLVCRIRPPA